MPESIDVSAGNQAYAADYNALRDDALRMLLAQGIGDSETTIISGALTITSDNIGFVTVGAQTGVEDQLDTMTVASLDDGDMVVLMATAGDEITIADSSSTDGFSLGGEDFILEGEMVAGFVHKGTTWYNVFSQFVPIGSFTVTLGNGISPILDGVSVPQFIPYDMEIIRTKIVAPNESGTIRVECWHNNWANTPLDSADEIGEVILSSAQKAEDTGLAGWTSTRLVKDGSVLWYVDGNATDITLVGIEILYIRAGN